MYKTAGALSVLLVLCGLLAGCWSKHELNELAIVVGLGIDHEEDDRYRVTIQIVNPGAVTANEKMVGQAPVVTFESTGATLPEALRRMTVLSPRRLYFSHLRIVVFGEELARIGLRKPLDFISREPEMRNDFYLVVAKGTTASRILKTYSAMDPIPANNLYTKLALSDRMWAATGKITLNELIVDITKRGQNAILTGVVVQGMTDGHGSIANTRDISPRSNMVYYGSAVFRKDRMIGWIGEDETKGVNYVHNSVDKTLGFVDCPAGGKVSLNVVRTESKIRAGLSGELPVVNVYVRVEQDIAGVECDIDLAQTSSLDLINRESQRKITDLIESTVRTAQNKLGVDIFGFGTFVHRQQPKAWSRIKDWDEAFRKLEVNVRVETITRRIGTTQQSVSYQTKGSG